MWLLFLILSSLYFHCDYFDCSDSSSYRCCINKTDAYSFNPPGHYCRSIEWYSSAVRCSGVRDFYVGNDNTSKHYCCKYYEYTPPRIPQRTPQLTPQLTQTPQRMLNVATKQSKKSTDFLVTFATTLFD